MSRDCVIILQKLLLREPTSRLGTGPNGAADVRNQTFFNNIHWADIYDKTAEPRFVPDLKTPTGRPAVKLVPGYQAYRL